MESFQNSKIEKEITKPWIFNKHGPLICNPGPLRLLLTGVFLKKKLYNYDVKNTRLHYIFNNYISHCNHSDHFINKKNLKIPMGYTKEKVQKDKQRYSRHKQNEKVNVTELYDCCLIVKQHFIFSAEGVFYFILITVTK